MTQLSEQFKSRIDLAASEVAEALRTKTLHGKRTHHSAVEHRALEHFAIEFRLTRDVAHESAGEAIARAGGINNFFDRQCRSAEGMQSSFLEKRGGAIFAVLDHEHARSVRENLLRGARQAVGLA